METLAVIRGKLVRARGGLRQVLAELLDPRFVAVDGRLVLPVFEAAAGDWVLRLYAVEPRELKVKDIVYDKLFAPLFVILFPVFGGDMVRELEEAGNDSARYWGGAEDYDATLEMYLRGERGELPDALEEVLRSWEGGCKELSGEEFVEARKCIEAPGACLGRLPGSLLYSIGWFLARHRRLAGRVAKTVLECSGVSVPDALRLVDRLDALVPTTAALVRDTLDYIEVTLDNFYDALESPLD